MDAEAMTHIDAAGLQALEDLAGTLEDDGIALHFARAEHPIADRVADARFHGTVRAALRAAARDVTDTPARS